MTKEENERNEEKRTEIRSEEEMTVLMQRLNRIEGQVRGLKRMLEKNSYCPDVLVQVSAVTSALNSFGKVLLSEHLQHYVVDEIREGKTDMIDELVVTLGKILK